MQEADTHSTHLCMPGTFRGAGDTTVRQTERNAVSQEAHPPCVCVCVCACVCVGAGNVSV